MKKEIARARERERDKWTMHARQSLSFECRVSNRMLTGLQPHLKLPLTPMHGRCCTMLQVSRHAGFQGSLSWYSTTSYFGSDPYKYGNVLCGDPLGRPAHPIIPPSPTAPKCMSERSAGLWFTMYVEPKCKYMLTPISIEMTIVLD